MVKWTWEAQEADDCRVAPVLKDASAAGKINLTSIVNTHQYVYHIADVTES